MASFFRVFLPQTLYTLLSHECYMPYPFLLPLIILIIYVNARCTTVYRRAAVKQHGWLESSGALLTYLLMELSAS
jgi:hypothetical protein